MPAQASLRSLRKLGCERGHDGGGVIHSHRNALQLDTHFAVIARLDAQP